MAREFARSFYSSAAWQSCRNEYIKRAHYLCEDCLKRGIYKPAKEVHHIEELTPENIHRPEIALSFDNLVALCKECHKARHNEREKGRRYLFGENGTTEHYKPQVKARLWQIPKEITQRPALL